MQDKREPLVCAVMLVDGRLEMARRAVKAFRAQTYQNRQLLVYDTGDPWLRESLDLLAGESDFPMLASPNASSVGVLRNRAARLAIDQIRPEIFVHWDSDDWSHPNRITEQVALLQSSGADVVGYNEMLFWDSRGCGDAECAHVRCDQAWRYHCADPSFALGTSLCYWRKTWEQKPFGNTSQGEDTQFLLGLRVAGVSSFSGASPFDGFHPTPRMMASIHPGNTSNAYSAAAMAREEWKRVPGWDEYCAEVMAL